MRKLVHWTAAAALSLGGFAFTTGTWAEDTVGNKVDRAVDKTKNAAENAVDNTKAAAHDAKTKWSDARIHTMLGQVTNAALTNGGFDDMIERFNDADRNRLGSWAKDKNNKEKLDVLNGRINQFQGDWKSKYGHEFKIRKDDLVFGHPAIFSYAQGEIGKDAQLAGEKLPPAQNVTKDNLSQPKDATGNTAADRNLEKGRNVAYVTVAESHGMPELKVPLIHELPDVWKIDVPDSVTGQMLYENLLKHLTTANEMKDKWPTDENDAYRAVSHHVLMAVMNVDHDAKHGASGKLGGDTTDKK
jgi:hypothetical protein